MRRGEVDADRERRSFPLDRTHRNGDCWHASEVGGYGKYILQIHRYRIALLTELERWRERRRESDDIASLERFVIFAAQHCTSSISLLVIGIDVALGEHKRAEQDAATRLFAETFGARVNVVVQKRFPACNMSVSHTVETREIGRDFGWHDDVIGRESM